MKVILNFVSSYQLIRSALSPISSQRNFRAGGIFDNEKLLSRNYLFNFRATYPPANNRNSACSENSTDWKSAFKLEIAHLDDDRRDVKLGLTQLHLYET